MHRKRLFYRLKNNERGVAALEFALVLPILIFLVMGILEFGWLFNGWITINGAAREGARVASVLLEFEDKSYITEAVQEHAKPLFSEEKVSATANLSNGDSRIVVNAIGEMQPLVGFFVKGPQSLRGEAIMRVD